ncbi:MAG TPA: hypothetical protein VLI05_00925 [Candidatus Saccharimonadia bacterium]|nr:hypothetical protein [Candidatus Saccharimonadia bacterium]
MPKLCLIDALGPFYRPNPNQPVVNWSKVDFANLETDGQLTAETRAYVAARFEQYLEQVTALGYNAVSLDDLAHVVALPFYRPALQRLIGQYQQLYRRLFALARAHGVAVYINSDYMFRNADIDTHLRGTSRSTQELFAQTFEAALRLFPEIAGLILRIGEHDGLDVTSEFVSRIELRQPQQLNALLRRLLPICEQHEVKLIVRTWTVGMHPVGDLIWSRRTFDRVFGEITSQQLIISMKYGDTDFMRHLDLNPLLVASHHPIMVELQARREWEGMGLYPSFVGWDYANYLAQLRHCPQLVGIQVWCQTGGWARPTWSTVSFLDEGSFWNELNAAVTVRLYERGESVREAVAAFCQAHSIADAGGFERLLQLSDQAVKDGLYVREFAQQPRYVRRSRLPSLGWLAWDRVVTEPVLIGLMRELVRRPQAAVEQGRQAAAIGRQMVALGRTLHLPAGLQASLEFERDTLEILAVVRQAMLQGLTAAEFEQLKQRVLAYTDRYPQHYRIDVAALQQALRQAPPPGLSRLLVLATRRRAAYRPADRLLLITSPLQRWLIRWYLRRRGSFLAKQAMGLEAIFT